MEIKINRVNTPKIKTWILILVSWILNKLINNLTTILEFKNIVVELNYFEDIFNNGVSGSIVVNDSMNYIQILQLQGQEVSEE